MDAKRMQKLLRIARIDHNHAQIDVAYHAKRSRSSISRFERGETDTLYMKQGIMRYLNHVNYQYYEST